MLNFEWLKNKAKEKFYPITHAKGVLYGENADSTVADVIDNMCKIADVSFTHAGYGLFTTNVPSGYKIVVIDGKMSIPSLTGGYFRIYEHGSSGPVIVTANFTAKCLLIKA